jgi:hypothetical protein
VEIPPGTVTDQYLARRGEQLDVVFDVDLGEFVKGHRVIARGIMLGRPARVPRDSTSPLRDLVRRGEDPSNGGGVLPQG